MDQAPRNHTSEFPVHDHDASTVDADFPVPTYQPPTAPPHTTPADSLPLHDRVNPRHICGNPPPTPRSLPNRPLAAPPINARRVLSHTPPHDFRSPPPLLPEHSPRAPAGRHGPPPAHGVGRRRRRRDGGGRAAGLLRRRGRGGGGGRRRRHAPRAGAGRRHDVLRVHGRRRGRAIRAARGAEGGRVAAPEPRRRRLRPRARQGPSARWPRDLPSPFLRQRRRPRAGALSVDFVGL